MARGFPGKPPNYRAARPRVPVHSELARQRSQPGRSGPPAVSDGEDRGCGIVFNRKSCFWSWDVGFECNGRTARGMATAQINNKPNYLYIFPLIAADRAAPNYKCLILRRLSMMISATRPPLRWAIRFVYGHFYDPCWISLYFFWKCFLHIRPL